MTGCADLRCALLPPTVDPRAAGAAGANQDPNQRARRAAPNCTFSAAYSGEGS